MSFSGMLGLIRQSMTTGRMDGTCGKTGEERERDETHARMLRLLQVACWSLAGFSGFAKSQEFWWVICLQVKLRSSLLPQVD